MRLTSVLLYCSASASMTLAVDERFGHDANGLLRMRCGTMVPCRGQAGRGPAAIGGYNFGDT